MLLAIGKKVLAIWHIIHQCCLRRCRKWWWVDIWSRVPWSWGCPSTSFLLIHSQQSDISMCIGALVLSCGRYAQWCHWHVYCQAGLSSHQPACNDCGSSWHNLQSHTPLTCFLQSSPFVKASTSWADTWLLFWVLHQLIYRSSCLWGSDLIYLVTYLPLTWKSQST